MVFYNLNTSYLYNFTKINKGLDFLIDTDYHGINKEACTCTKKKNKLGRHEKDYFSGNKNDIGE